MKISAKTDYACRAILELALHWPQPKPVQIGVLSKRQKIPLKFLTQIMLGLKHLGYVESTRGKEGGYLLVRAPKEIKLSDLIGYFEDIEWEKTGGRQHNTMEDIWKEARQGIFEVLDKYNYEMIVRRQRKSENTVIFEI